MDLQVWVKKGMEKLRSFGIKQWGMVLLAGLCCLVIVVPFGKEQETPDNSESKHSDAKETKVQEDVKNDYAGQLEERLEALLSTVENVGRVKVMVTVNSTVEKKVLQDGSSETEQITEADSAGGNRSALSERREGTTVFYDIGGSDTPYILSETYPAITGVVVIAEGSGRGTVDLDILDAVQVLFDVPAHKIKIMKMK